MTRHRFIAVSFILATLFLCQDVQSQTPVPQTVAAAGDSGLIAVKSRWYRHVAMMSIPIITAQGTMGNPINMGGPGGSYAGSRRGFMYEAKIKNTSGREVKALHWDHVFLDPASGKELRRFHFFSDRQSIGKGKTTTFLRMSGMPPSGVIDVGQLDKDNGPQYIERIDIKCVLYKGEVFWQSAIATNPECAQVRRKLKPKPTK